MAKIWTWIALFLFGAVLFWISFCHTAWLSDENAFLKDFLDNDVLSVLGFITAVTLASASNIYLQINELSDATGKKFRRTKAALKKSAISLIILFGFAVIVVVIKPLIGWSGLNQALVNSAALMILFFNIVVMLDLTMTVFSIPSKADAQK